MRVVGVKVLKNRLSEFLRIVAAGETVLVADRDRVVAEIVPPQPGRGLDVADAMLADAVRKGYIRPPALAAGGVPPRLPVAPLSDLLSELDADRADR